MYYDDEEKNLSTGENVQYLSRVRIVGCGGAGCNAINNIMKIFSKDYNSLFIAIDTNQNSLENCTATKKLQLGKEGQGAGSDPQLGEELALEYREEIKNLFNNIELTILICSIGGGTGTGSSPVVAECAKKSNSLVMTFITLPFEYERKSQEYISTHLEKIKSNSDFVSIISNETLGNTTEGIIESFYTLDRWYATIINVIFTVIYKTNKEISTIISADFSDLKTIIKNTGFGLISLGYGDGEQGPVRAIEECLKSAFIYKNLELKTIKSVMVNIVTTSATNNAITMDDVKTIFNVVFDFFKTDAMKIIHSISSIKQPSQLTLAKGIGLKSTVVFLLATGLEFSENSENNLDFNQWII